MLGDGLCEHTSPAASAAVRVPGEQLGANSALTDPCYPGHTASPQPLKRIAHPTTHAIDIIPRPALQSQRRYQHHTRSIPLDAPQLLHSDSFRLTLSAFDEVFHLHLRPNDELVHPDARIIYHTASPDGSTLATHSVPLLRETVRAYWGEVVAPHLTADRLRQDIARVMRPTGNVLGWARIIVHDQGDADSGRSPVFEGAFSVNGIVHHVMTKVNYLRNKHRLDPHPFLDQDHPDSGLVIWRDSDQLGMPEYAAETPYAPSANAGARTCSHDDLAWNTNPSLNPVLRRPPSIWSNPLAGLLLRRDDIAGNGTSTNFVNNIGQSAGCPTDQRVLYMGVATDCEYTSNYGSVENATQQILNDFNTASALYKASRFAFTSHSTFNVSLGIIELQIQPPTCPTTTNSSVPWNIGCNATNVDLNSRLSLFSQWRGNKGADGAGLWHLVSGCPTGSEIGVAWLATLCQQTAQPQGGQFVSGTGVSTIGRTEWQVVAHEIGHNFGAICANGCNSTSACCPLSSTTCDANSQFIMNPVADSSERVFSPCTLGNICSLMGSKQMNTSCLVPPDPNIRTISLNECGNGIVEGGEDCDPGTGVNSTCCNTSTCKFNAGAVCDPSSSSCCTSQCQFAPVTTVCRPAKNGTCDTPEMCTGNSASCPADVFAPNGQSCGSNGLQCADGQCTSLDLQCQQAGASMGLTRACGRRDDTSCRVSCQNPNSTNACVVLTSQLVDGSPCGYGGSCNSGNCIPGSALDTFRALYTQNLQIAIPVTVVAGLFALLLIVLIVRSCWHCMRSRRSVPPPGALPGRAFARPDGHRRLDSSTGLLGQHHRLGSDPTLGRTYASIAPAFPRSASVPPTLLYYTKMINVFAVHRPPQHKRTSDASQACRLVGCRRAR
ncbi:Metallo-peptidase family M12B Reprolysin-like-domain-containing protein [Vararia minispora EC-137]|uniref:Metallo-peptidase family M12B Reprolysin-like-domain-containing protein n=1 Tax=Vararia minispora EC-137 TaxID=1314806 RepID=A0ACB8QTZ5_9AGAM|nr:Metallo-peptidase family M12B Reprolysin-like-domain-containing protein [Vararia minispora EC-137]